MLRQSCPICHGNAQKIFARDFQAAAPIVPFLHYDVMVCPECGMAYAGNIVESMPLLAYYDIMSKYETDFYQDAQQDWQRYTQEVDFLSSYVDKQAAIVDIGCAAGGLLWALHETGYQHLTGIEPSAQDVAYIKEHHQIEAYVGCLGGEQRPMPRDRKFDLVILNNVLEHVIPLHEAVKDCLSYLKIGGLLYIEVPDLEHFADQPDLYQQFSVEHVNYFSKGSLADLLGRYGFSLQGIQQNGGQLYTLWRYDKAAAVHPFPIQDKDFLRQYLSVAAGLVPKMQNRLAAFHGQPVYLWGAGTHTMMLYQAGILADMDVVGIIDANKNYEGKVIYGQRILYPSAKISPDILIVISTQYVQDAVKNDIHEKWHLTNPVLCLYE